MMYEIEAKVELSPREEYCIPDDITRKELVIKLAKQLMDKIIVQTMFNPLTGKTEYSTRIIFTNR